MNSMQLRKVSNALILASVLGVGATLLSATPAHAGSAPANLAVSASIAANCTISTTAVAFGAYDPVVTNATTALNASEPWMPMRPPSIPTVIPLKVRMPFAAIENTPITRPRIATGALSCTRACAMELNASSRKPARKSNTRAAP